MKPRKCKHNTHCDYTIDRVHAAGHAEGLKTSLGLIQGIMSSS